METLAKPPMQDVAESLTCLRKLRHDNFLSALHHARCIDDGGIGIYGCKFCAGLHLGHHSSTPSTKLRRNKGRLDRAREALRTNDGSMKPVKRQAYEQRIRDLTQRQTELEAEVREEGPQNPAFPPELDWWALASIFLINLGVRLQHLGCDCADRSKRPWKKLKVESIYSVGKSGQ